MSSLPSLRLLGRLLPVRRHDSAQHDGLELVQRLLERVVERDPRWGLVDEAPLGHGEANPRLVIGPAGVLVLSTHDHPDASVWVQGDHLKVNGTVTPYVRRIRRDTARTAAALTAQVDFSVPVQAVIVFAHTEHFTLKRQPDDVTVLDRTLLAHWITALPSVLLPTETRALRTAAAREETWA